jgi:mannose-1-phosphate guanylyltransferase/phosphomannomutase
MKAVVMAGGEGSRLRPLTLGRPKPMIPMVNKPVMAHILELLKKHGFTEIVVTVQYLADNIRNAFGDGEGYGLKIAYSLEDTPLGTAGSVKKAQEYLDDTFLVISGDAVTDFNLTEIVNFHKANKSLATLTLYRVPNPLEYGVVIIDNEGHIRQFLEKPSWGEVFSDTINTGIYVLQPEVLNYFEKDKPFDFSQDLFPILLKKNDPLFGYVAAGYWCDVGNIQEYMRATADVLHQRVQVEPLGKHIGGDIWTDEDVEIAPNAQLFGPIYLGRGVKIKGGVIISGPTVIRDYTIVDDRANIERSVIWRDSYIGERVEVRGSIVGRQCIIKSSAVLFEGVILGDSSVVGEGAVLHPNVKIWPDKEIEPGAIVRSSLIWGAQGRRVLFGRYGVTGLVNVDITPEFAAKLGAAYGATLPKGSAVTMNRDPHRTPRMIKRAMISGLPSAGVNVWDIKALPIPVARYYTRVSGAVGGVHVRLSPFDARAVDIKFFDKRGMDVDKATQRRIENTFFREDFRRAYLEEISLISDATHVVESYTEGFLQKVDVEAIRKANFQIVVDYALATTSLVLPAILNRLGCRVVALNAGVDETKMSIPSEELERAIRQLAVICGPLQADLGVRLDVGGEKIFLVDDSGTVLSGTTALAAVASLALHARDGGTIAAPVTQSHVLEKIAERYSGQVLRTKVDPAALMAAATRDGVILAGDGEGGFAFPQFQPALDGMMAIAKILELLAKQGVKLSQVVRELPAYHVAGVKIACPWEEKGKVMRLLNEQYRETRGRQIDGINLEMGEEWVLILPDPDRPLFYVYAESSSDEQATTLAEKYAGIVRGLQQ